jgi:hypothetical protein
VPSRRVANGEPEFLQLLGDVLDIADGTQVTWAMDMAGGERGLLIALLANHGQELVTSPASRSTRPPTATAAPTRPTLGTPAWTPTRPACAANCN